MNARRRKKVSARQQTQKRRQDVATIGTDVVVSCGNSADEAINVPVPYDYQPPAG